MFSGLCNFITDSHEELNKHITQHETDERICQKCDFQALDLADYFAHRLEYNLPIF